MAKDDTEYKNWLEELQEWQDADKDQRDQARRCDEFILEPDGQWEPKVAATLDSQGRPRYTFDKLTPMIESMMADIEDMDFGCTVKPADGAATKDNAKVLEGLIRAIQNDSRADSLFRTAVRRVMRRGFDAWMTRADYESSWSFDQTIKITPITNALNRVWTSPSCKKADSSDTPAAYVLTSISVKEYNSRWPDRTPLSVDDGSNGYDYNGHAAEVVTIAERYYRKPSRVEVAQLNTGEVVRVDEKFSKIKDELAARGQTVVKTKMVDDYVWCYVVFDGNGQLEKERETVFTSCPIVTVYGNYEHVGESSKITYSGAVLKNMDAQMVHNYAKSREIEEGALSPRGKWWMTQRMAAGHEDSLERMNISADPVQFYNPDENAPQGPQFGGGPQTNPHLIQLGAQMANDIEAQMGVFSAMKGDFAGRMSEDTVRMQIDRGTASTRKWVNAVIDGIRRTCELLVQAIPVVYDTKRTVQIIGIDGAESQVVLNEEIFDQQSGTMVKLNDLNKGQYKIVCDAGPAFANRLEAGLDALLKYAQVDPAVVQQAGDVMLKAIDAPLVDQIAERKRAQMLQAGLIPVSQMTEEEQAVMAQRMQQPQQPSVEQILAQAELMNAQNDQAKLQLNSQLEAAKLQMKAQEQELARMKLELQAIQDDRKQTLTEAKTVADIENTRADTMKKLADTEKTSGETVAQQIDNIKAVTPQTTVVITGDYQ